MIPVQNIINSVVKEHEFVVLPEFGAILSHQIAASFDSERGKFIPASRKLSFNESLKQDDGFLANYISRNESITHQEALLYLKKYIQILKLEIQNVGSTQINGVGIFQRNGEGRLLFEPDYNQSIKDNWYGFIEINAKKIKLVDKDLVLKNIVETVAYVSDEEVVKVRPINWYKWSAAAMLVGVLTYSSYFLVVNNDTINKSNLSPFSFFNDSFEDQLKNTPTTTATEILEAPISALEVIHTTDSAKTDVNPIEVVNQELEITNQPIVELTNYEYYLIAGVFKGEKQALKMKDQMIQKGYETCIVIPADELSSKYKVAVKGFSSKQEANAQNSDLKKVIGELGWVYTKR